MNMSEWISIRHCYAIFLYTLWTMTSIKHERFRSRWMVDQESDSWANINNLGWTTRKNIKKIPTIRTKPFSLCNTTYIYVCVIWGFTREKREREREKVIFSGPWFEMEGRNICQNISSLLLPHDLLHDYDSMHSLFPLICFSFPSFYFLP